jgi:KDO2-lipid IV(A) lauroyltransferase
MTRATGAPPPDRPARPGRRLRAHATVALAAVLGALFRLLPWPAAQAAGGAFGGLVWHLSRRDRRRILDHLALAFPELPDAERELLARACFRHLGIVAGEFLWLLRRSCRHLAPHVAVEGWEVVEDLRARGRPILFVTGHCGNWELLGAAANCRGAQVTYLARALDEPPLQRFLAAFRARFAGRTIERGGAGAAREMLHALRRRGGLAMLIDQDTRVEGVWVPFFGRPAFTPVGPARLALKRDVAVVPVFDERLPDGSHRARFDPPLELPADEVAATAMMTRAIEAQIRRVPEQWVWMHRRWRRQPV